MNSQAQAPLRQCVIIFDSSLLPIGKERLAFKMPIGTADRAEAATYANRLQALLLLSILPCLWTRGTGPLFGDMATASYYHY